MEDKFLKFSFSLPVYNEEKRIKSCLDSILMQDYPVEKKEVLLIDGGSTDKTIEIASRYEFVKIFPNPKKLADFGAKISAKEATGELFVIFAADNELLGYDWLKAVNKVFLYDKEISTLWCPMKASMDDSALNRYYELIQNDPLSFFINKNLQNYLKKSKVERFNGTDSYIFDVDKDKPLIWGANGLVYRTSSVRDIILREGFLGDNDVFQELVESGDKRVAYLTNLFVYHHHLTGLRQWVSKWKRNYLEHFLGQRQTRNLGWVMDKHFKVKLFFWIFYSLIPIFSLIHALYYSIRQRNIYWLYHPLASFLQVLVYSYLTISTVKGRKMIKDLFWGRKL